MLTSPVRLAKGSTTIEINYDPVDHEKIEALQALRKIHGDDAEKISDIQVSKAL